MVFDILKAFGRYFDEHPDHLMGKLTQNFDRVPMTTLTVLFVASMFADSLFELTRRRRFDFPTSLQAILSSSSFY